MKTRSITQGILIILYVVWSMVAFSQVGINTSGVGPDPSAMLDVNSNNKGVLFPRMTTLERDAIPSPTEGLLIFNTTTKCFEFFCYGEWQKMVCGTCTPPAQPSAITGDTALYNPNVASFYGVIPMPGITYSWSYTGTGFSYYFTSPPSTYQIATYFTSSSTPGKLICTPHSSQCNTAGTPRELYVNLHFPCVIGAQRNGGVVFYVGNNRCYIAPMTDQGIYSSPWSNGTYTTTGATGTTIGTGISNTTAIVNSQGPGSSIYSYAAKICDTLNLGGYTDWFLPSKDELEQLYIQRSVMVWPMTLTYWSSTEINTNQASGLNFFNGLVEITNKDYVSRVRCVRSFYP